MTNNTTNEYDNSTDLNSANNFIDNCTDNDTNIVIITPTLLLTIPRGLSCLFLMSFMVYTISKSFITK